MPNHHELHAIAQALIAEDEFPGVEITRHEAIPLEGGTQHVIYVTGITLRGSLVILEHPPGEVKSFRFIQDETKP